MRRTWSWLSLSAAIMALFCCICVCAHAKADLSTETLTYTIEDGEIVIIGCIGAPTTLVIPDSISGKPVVRIEDHAFENCSSITSVTLPDSIVVMGAYAFKGTSITQIRTPLNWVEVSFRYAADRMISPFAGCTTLTSVTVPDGVTVLPEYAFTGGTAGSSATSSISNISLPGTLEEIGTAAFAGTGIMSVTLPAGLILIGDEAFRDCTALSAIALPDGLAQIGCGAFINCESLTGISLPDSIAYMGAMAFKGTSLSVVQTPLGWTEVNSYGTDRMTSPFAGCTTLTSVIVPEGVINLPNYAFAGCAADGCLTASITSIALPSTLKKIGSNAFAGTGISSVILPAGLKEIGVSAFCDCANLSSISLPDSITTMGAWAFMGTSITQVQTPMNWNQVVYGTGADRMTSPFAGCTTLIRVIVPEGATALPAYAFAGCAADNCSTAGIASVTLPDTLTKIGTDAFAETGVVSVILPAALTEINDNAFRSCESLTQLVFMGNKPDIGQSAVPTGAVLYYTHDSTGWSSSDGVMYCHVSDGVILPLVITYKPTKDPDCVEDGYLAHYECENCGHCFANEAATIHLGKENLILPAYGHEWGEPVYTWSDDNSTVTAFRQCALHAEHTETETVIVNATVILRPTCTEKGMTTYTGESFDNPAFTDQSKTMTDIDALGHDWSETVYTWADDNSTVTAFRQCFRDETHTETETVSVTSEITLEPSCTDRGETTFNSGAFANSAFAVQSKTLTNLDPLGHDWGEPIYTWADDNSSVTAVRNCRHDSSHAETQTVSVTAQISRQPDCTEWGETTYTGAAFTNEAFTAQSKIVANMEPLGHIWRTPTYIWATDNSTVTATHRCVRNTMHSETETVTVTSVIVLEPTCTEEGEITYSGAAFENAAFTAQSKTLAIEALDHDWSEPVYTWADDNSTVTASRYCYRDPTHTQSETATVTSLITVEPTCTAMGETTYMGAPYENPAFIAQSKTLMDVEMLGHDWSEPVYTWASDNSTVTAHHYCLRDSEHAETETVTVTTFVILQPTCTEEGKTLYTSAEFSNDLFVAQSKTLTDLEALDHEWSEPEYTWADDNSTVTASCYCYRDPSHAQTETVAVTSVIAVEPTCTTMGETTYTGASYSNPVFIAQSKTLMDIDALGHDWSEPVYTWAADNSVVTATRSCAHNETHIETETVVVSAEVILQPTCTTKGKTTYTTAGFNNPAFAVQSKTLTDIDALGHDWTETIYTWADDSSTVTASRQCTRDASHAETETVSVTSAITLAPTCTERGETTYTSTTFTNPAFAAQSKTLSNLNPLEHDWSKPVYTWAPDYSFVTATRHCLHDEAHTETETVAVTGTISKAPTCTGMGQTTYVSASFANEAFAAQSRILTDVQPVGHAWSNPVYTWADDFRSVTAFRCCENDASHTETETVALASEVTMDPTCTEDGTTTYTSAGFENSAFIAQTAVQKNADALGHEWKTPSYSWAANYTSVTATRRCARNTEHKETESVSTVFNITQSPTESGGGSCYICSHAFVNTAFTARSRTVSIPALGSMSVLHLPAGLQVIEAEAFMGLECQAVIIPDTCTSIGERAFANCKNLCYVLMPGELTDIASNAFSGSNKVIIERRGIWITNPLETAELKHGDIVTLTATVHPTYEAEDIIWSTSDATVASVSEDGVVTAGASGTAIITASTHDGRSDSITFTLGISFRMVFDANGGKCSVTEKHLNINEPAGTLPIPLREYYQFLGWYTEPTGGTLISGTYTKATNDDITVYAHWSRMTYRMSFNANGTEESPATVSPTSKQYEVGSPVDGLPTPSRSYYTFEGWFTAASGGVRITYDYIQQTTDDITVYAQWTPLTYSMVFNPNGSSETPATVNPGMKQCMVDVPVGALPTPNRDYYAFVGWFTAPLDGVPVDGTYVQHTNEGVTVYAHWTPNNYTITLNANGGTCSAASVQGMVGRAIGALPTPTRSYYTFAGWYKPDNSKVTESHVENNDAGFTVYAHWNPMEYTMLFNANGSSASPASVGTSTKQCLVDTAVGTLPTPTRINYDFEGWYTAVTGGTKVTSTFTHGTTGSVTVYAHWIPHVFSMYFNTVISGAVCSVTSKTCKVDTVVGTLPVPSLDYYTFDGWYTSASGGAQVTASTVYTTDAAVTIYAHWTLKPIKGWVTQSQIPAGAQIVQTSWSYRISTESESSSMDGWVANGDYWKQTGTGSAEYASFPSGEYDTNNKYYKEMAHAPYTASESATNKREVVNSSSPTGYIYWHWAINGTYSPTAHRVIAYKKGTYSDGYWYGYFYAIKSTTKCPKASSDYCTIGQYPQNGRTTYNCTTLINDTSLVPAADKTNGTSGLKTYRFYELQCFISTYTDYVKMYRYYKDLSYQFTDPGNGSNISNKVTYYMYRER